MLSNLLKVMAKKTLVTTKVPLDTYTRNVFTLINYKIEHNEPLTQYEQMIVICFMSGVIAKVEKGLENHGKKEHRD